jgi:hypothetical protein
MPTAYLSATANQVFMRARKAEPQLALIVQFDGGIQEKGNATQIGSSTERAVG